MDDFVCELAVRTFSSKDFAPFGLLKEEQLQSEQEQTGSDAKVSAVMDITPPNSDF